MITYAPFWETLRKKKISTYCLINKCKVSSSTIARLRHDLPVSTTTLNDLCRILECEIQEVAQYLPSEKDAIL